MLIDHISLGTHPKLVKRMEKVKSDFERELGVAQRRRDYEIQSINNQYDCIKQQIDLEYQVLKALIKRHH